MEPAPEEAGPASEPHPSSPHPDLKPTPAQRPETDENDHPTTLNPDDARNGPPQSSASSTSTTSRPISGVVPPYWRRHERNVSRASQSSLRGAAITLEDHTADPDSETSRGLWASSVTIDDHVVVRGMTGVGSYVVWNCTIQTLDVSLDYRVGIGVNMGSNSNISV
jgi:hypothetical protein